MYYTLWHFITHQCINLRIQPLIDLIDLSAVNIDVAIRWGKGDWSNPNEQVECIFTCPAMLSVGKSIYQQIKNEGIETTVNTVKLLDDRDGSLAWQDWFIKAEIDYVAKIGRHANGNILTVGFTDIADRSFEFTVSLTRCCQ